MRNTVTHYKINLAVVFAVTVISIGFSAPSMADAGQFCASKKTQNACSGGGNINGKLYRCTWTATKCQKQWIP